LNAHGKTLLEISQKRGLAPAFVHICHNLAIGKICPGYRGIPITGGILSLMFGRHVFDAAAGIMCQEASVMLV